MSWVRPTEQSLYQDWLLVPATTRYSNRIMVVVVVVVVMEMVVMLSLPLSQ